MCVPSGGGEGANATSLSVCLGEGKRTVVLNVLPPWGGASGGHIDNKNVHASLEEGHTIQKTKHVFPEVGACIILLSMCLGQGRRIFCFNVLPIVGWTLHIDAFDVYPGGH